MLSVVWSLRGGQSAPEAQGEDGLRVLGVEFDNDEIDSIGQMHLGAVAKVGRPRPPHCAELASSTHDTVEDQRTRSVGQLVGGMREDVVEPGENAVRIAIRSDRVAQRMGRRCIKTMTGRHRSSQHANRCERVSSRGLKGPL